ncbi:MAG TPA: tripartite tricarboxylate transporter TctB family protein [Anaeromyxobacteraceae bacterium]|nr:tripartite tricarboxylate transporter TctB family protein [Anaeromyxobacteraceae bacterium]
MKVANLAIALLLAAIAALVVADAVRLGFRWGANGPQAGFFPFWLGVGLFICAAIEVRRVWVQHRKRVPSGRLMPRGAWKPIAWVVAPAIGMVLLTELVGLHLAAGIYLGFYMHAIGKVRWSTTLAVAIVVPLLLYVAFDKLFLVPMPQGLWGGMLLRF